MITTTSDQFSVSFVYAVLPFRDELLATSLSLG